MHATRLSGMALAVAGLLGASSSAAAAFVGLFLEGKNVPTPVTDPTVPGPARTYFVRNLWIGFSSPADRLLSVTAADFFFLNGFNFFQHPFGGTTAPNGAFFGLAPALPMDSFVTIGLKSVPVGGTDSTALEPGTAFINPSIPTAFAGGWYNSNPDNDQGTPGAHGAPAGAVSGTFYVLIAQLTVKNATTPSSLYGGHALVGWKSFGGVTQFSPISFISTLGPLPPAPGALPLLAIAGLAGCRRRA